MTNRSCRCSNLCFSTIRLKVCMVWSCVDSILCSRRINSFSLILTIPGCPSCASVRTWDLNLLGITILVPRRISSHTVHWLQVCTAWAGRSSRFPSLYSYATHWILHLLLMLLQSRVWSSTLEWKLLLQIGQIHLILCALPLNQLGSSENKHYHKGKKTSGEPGNKTCYRCGNTGHFGRDPECPAKGKTCRSCGGADHFSSQCRSKERKRRGNKKPKEKSNPPWYQNCNTQQVEILSPYASTWRASWYC